MLCTCTDCVGVGTYQWTQITVTMDTGATNTTTILDHLESFLYTPYGLAALAAAAIVLTSLVWLLGCCLCCCCYYCKKRRDRMSLGVAEANGDLRYVSTSISSPGNEHGLQHIGTGTGSSGYHSNTDTFNYSLNSLNDEMVAHSSLDSILHQ